MNTERPIREWYDMLPEPLRSEANAARDRAEARDPLMYPNNETTYSLPLALVTGWEWILDGESFDKWDDIHFRAVAGEFDAPSEVDRLRARVAELEEFAKQAHGLIMQCKSDAEDMDAEDRNSAWYDEVCRLNDNAHSILNKK